MFGRQHIIAVLASALWLIGGSFAPVHASPATDAGVRWLNSVQAADGYWGKAFGGTPIRDTTAAVNALREVSPASTSYARAVQWLLTTGPLVTDYTARRITALAGTGNDLTASLTALKTAQHPDGGWGLDSDHESNPLDTALALQALSAANYNTGSVIPEAVGYLLGRQQSGGGFADGDNSPSVFVSAQAMRALWYYRRAYVGVPAALTNAQNFLLAQRGADGAWGEPFETALALLALVPNVTDLALVDGAATALTSAQLANGSWSDDPYTTALAMQAISAYQARQGGATPTLTGALSGYVVRAGSTEPIGGAQVTLAERPGTSVLTNSAGYFLIPSLPPGTYTVTAGKSGYTSASLVASAQGGQVTLAGTLALGVATQSGLVVGKVYDAQDLTALPGASVTLTGGAVYSALTGADGSFNLGALTFYPALDQAPPTTLDNYNIRT